MAVTSHFSSARLMAQGDAGDLNAEDVGHRDPRFARSNRDWQFFYLPLIPRLLHWRLFCT
jgi:hypothetical protein